MCAFAGEPSPGCALLCTSRTTDPVDAGGVAGEARGQVRGDRRLHARDEPVKDALLAAHGARGAVQETATRGVLHALGAREVDVAKAVLLVDAAPDAARIVAGKARERLRVARQVDVVACWGVVRGDGMSGGDALNAEERARRRSSVRTWVRVAVDDAKVLAAVLAVAREGVARVPVVDLAHRLGRLAPRQRELLL